MISYILLFSLITTIYILVHGFPSHSIDTHRHPHHGGHWDHVDQSQWPGICRTGYHQSPIDIQTSNVILNDDHTTSAIRVVETAIQYPRMFISNNGHSVTFHLDKDVRIFGGEFDEGKYEVQQLHFHWGSDNNRGSEHTIDGRHYAMEMHMVTYDTSEFKSFHHALGQKGGIAVLSTLFVVSGADNTDMIPLVDAIQSVRSTSSNMKVSVHDFDLHALLPRNTKNFFSYKGSLTTPMCNENVDWTIFYEHAFISQYQIDQFRKLRTMDGTMLADNNRDLQNLNGRVIYRS